MSDKPRVCSMPQFQGIPVENKEYIKDLRTADLNMDGVEDEYYMVQKRVLTICGELPEVAIRQIVEQNFGKYEDVKKSEGGGTFVGSFWRTSYKVGDGMTVISANVAMPYFSNGVLTSFRMSHLKQDVRVADPVKLKDGKEYFVGNISLSEALRWDGKEMTVDSSRIEVSVLTKKGVMAMREGKEVSKEDIRQIKLSDIKSIVSRDKYPDVYALNDQS